MDGLTGIPNRRRFDETLTLEWNRTRRHGAPLALILLDIDFFKSYNDHYGHPQGDDCLRKVAAVLAATLQRASDTLARYGGEEFAAILPDTSLDSAVDMAELMRCRVMDLAIPHGYSRVAACVTVSLGVAACIPAERNSAAELVEAADGALYQAKHAGRNRVGR